MKTRLTAIAAPLLIVAVVSTPTIEALRGIKEHLNNDIVERQLSDVVKNLADTLQLQVVVETDIRDKCEAEERTKILKKLEKCESVFEKIRKKKEADACAPFERVIIDDSEMNSEIEFIQNVAAWEREKKILELPKPKTAMITEEVVITEAKRRADTEVQAACQIQIPDLRELLDVNERELVKFEKIPNVRCPVVENPGGEEKVQVCLLRSGRTHEILVKNLEFNKGNEPGGLAKTKKGTRRFLCGPCENYAATKVKAKRTPRGNQCDSDEPIITVCQDESKELKTDHDRRKD